jgi:hypothetical protein
MRSPCIPVPGGPCKPKIALAGLPLSLQLDVQDGLVSVKKTCREEHFQTKDKI